MAVLTGADGQLQYGGRPIAKTRDWTINISVDALETSSLGDYDRNYVRGLRGTTGSMTVLYDPGSDSATDLLDSILLDQDASGNSQLKEVTFVFNKSGAPGSGNFEANGFLTSVSQSVSVGAVQACSCNFQINDKVDGEFG